jgi:integrase
VQQTITGLRNYYSDTSLRNPKVALTQEDLLAFHKLLDERFFENARDWCAMLIAFFACLRVGEYMNGRLCVRDVEIHVRHSLVVTVLYSKTALVPHPVRITARPDELCPVRALLRYESFFPALGLRRAPGDPVFVVRRPDGKSLDPMPAEAFIARLREALGSAFPERDASRYAGHSFRRGGATAMHIAGHPLAVIKKHGRWASDAVLDYLDDANLSEVALMATRRLISP